MKCYFRKFVVLTVSCAAQLWVPPSVSQRCSMRWLASCPPTLLPASPAVFSITMRSCGVVNLPTKTPLSPLSLCSLCLSLSTFPHSSRRPSPSLADTCRRLFVTSLQLSRPLSSLHRLPPSCFFFSLLKPDLHNLVPLTQLFGALAVAGQFPQFHQSIKVAFSSYSYSWRREIILGE